MPMYTKTKKFHHIRFNPQKIKNLSEWIPAPNNIFYHHFYDDQQQGVRFQNCIDEEHWEHLRKNPLSKLLHENCGETFNYRFIEEIICIVNERKILPSQIYVIVADDVHLNFAVKKLYEKNIIGVNFTTFNFLLSKVNFNVPNISSNSKFTMLSRNYRPLRLQLYCELLKKNLLKNFTYSFYNIHPYEQKSFSVTKMMEDLKNLKIPITEEILQWLYDVPYKINSVDNVFDKWADVTYQAIASSDIHIVIETFFDPFMFHVDGKYVRDSSPSFITEKIYKPIACKKPFIVFGTPYILEDLKTLGYKTFGKYINEEYDKEEDNQKRLQMIVAEIERISNLSKIEYDKLINDLNEICNFNYEILKKQQATLSFNDSFDFINEYLNESR